MTPLSGNWPAVDLEHVLLIEDDPDIRQVVGLALGDVGGLRVSACDGGQSALDTLDGWLAEPPADDWMHRLPQLILLDLMMPGMDGRQTLAHLGARSTLAGLPVVMMTARAHAPAGVPGEGTIGLIAKPFDPMTLADRVRDLWEAARRPGQWPWHRPPVATGGGV
ncbi:response regulator [Roseospirillum parvum]|uniref:Response regulator receiver domain-containing protein n=1 Tax=Roseospirillum parvum TaxID=83401 RepID=A0A1G7UAU1_9PROT|nr:response regulator [Roseospirillum parvum]SDG43870.1 Response regulator receiver domain-containing protein [Roseospirillum parvum]